MFQLSKHAAQQVSRAVSRVERTSRSVRPHRRRNQSAAGAPTALAIATLSSALAAGGSATFSFVVGGSGSGTCYDNLLCSTDSLANGSKVVIAKIDGQWNVIQATCPC